jgi:hypothetical protein
MDPPVSAETACYCPLLLLLVLVLLVADPGNFCVGGLEGRIPGNGRIVVSEFNDKEGPACGWDVVKVVNIPPSANFTDYSGMAFRGSRVSQH